MIVPNEMNIFDSMNVLNAIAMTTKPAKPSEKLGPMDKTGLFNFGCVLCVVLYVMNVFKVKCSGIITNRLPSGRSRPLADVARFLEPSLSSRSELRRVNCVPLPYDTFDMDVDRRWLQYEVFGDARFTSTGSNRRGVDEPNANDCKIRKRKITTKKR